MKRTNRFLTLAQAVLWGALASGCATTAAGSCRPGDSTAACCIKNYPLSPAESCAALPQDILTTLAAMDAAHQASRYTEAEDSDDFANNAHLPEWKQRCISGFVACESLKWTGNCYDCLRRCEGQRDWPTSMCHPPRGNRR